MSTLTRKTETTKRTRTKKSKKPSSSQQSSAGKKKLQFRVDWFSEHAPHWAEHLGRFRGRPNVSTLMVGAYDGRELLWLFREILTTRTSTAVVIDDYSYGDCVAYRGEAVWNPALEVRAALLDNLASANVRDRVSVLTHEEPNLVALKRLSILSYPSPPPFDIVHVSCQQSSKYALEALVLAFPLLAPGGVMVMTNYTHSKEHDFRCPRRGIDAFLDAFATELRVLRLGFHVFVQKRVQKLPLPPCHSEYFDEPEDPGFPRCREGRSK